MDAVVLLPLPWSVKQNVMQWVDRRCWLCGEGVGLLCHTGDGHYEMWCLDCFTGMLPDDRASILIDGFQRGVHSYTPCSCSSSVGRVTGL